MGGGVVVGILVCLFPVVIFVFFYLVDGGYRLVTMKLGRC